MARNSRRLHIWMLLPDAYDPGMPARPAVMEIYGNCFPEMGHKVTWIMPGHQSAEDASEKIHGKVRIFALAHNPGSSLIRKAFSTLRFLWNERKLISRMLRNGDRIDIVQARNSVFQAAMAVHLKRRLGIPFVFQYSFPSAEAKLWKYRLGHGNMLYLMAKLERIMVAYIMKSADLILPISQRMLDDLAREGIQRQNMMPLPLGVNHNLFVPSAGSDEIRASYRLGNSSVLLYLGTMDRLRQLDLLIQLLDRLKRNGRSAKLLLVGQGDDTDRLERLACELGVRDDVVFSGQIPYHEVPALLAIADVALSPVPPLDIYRVSSPCKLFEYMAVAKPIVANDEIPEHKEVLEASGSGILVPFTPEAFANAACELLDNPDVAKAMGRRGRDWVVNNRTYEILAQQLEQRYLSLIATDT